MPSYYIPYETPLFGKYRQVFDRIHKGASVLELGCHHGYLLYHLQQEKSCKVLGLEANPEAIQLAENATVPVLQSDLKNLDALNNRKFDVILLMDILEHLENPSCLMAGLDRYLLKGGKIIVTGPNVAHYKVRFSLLRGRWDYQDSGILDRTHLKFFTKKTWNLLFKSSGWNVTDFHPCDIVFPIVGRLRSIGIDFERHWPLSWIVQSLAKRYPTFFSVTFLFELVP